MVQNVSSSLGNYINGTVQVPQEKAIAIDIQGVEPQWKGMAVTRSARTPMMPLLVPQQAITSVVKNA